KFCAVDPAAIVIVDGTTTALVLDVSVTAIPPVGAALANETVPVTVVPAVTDADESVKPDNVAVVVDAAVVESVQAPANAAMRNSNPTNEVRITIDDGEPRPPSV